MNLSKSRYTSGIRCEKLLWLNQYHPELAEDMGNESVLENGNEVGDLARGLFGKSTLIDFNKGFESMINDTKELLKQKPNVICEASFNYDGNFCSVDVLKNDVDGVEIYEVKSSTEVKEIYIDDISYQTWVLKKCGLNVKKLEYPVNIQKKDLKMAKYLMAQYGGPDSELAASIRYLNQRYTMPDDKGKALLTDIGTEEINHLEIIASMIYQLMKGATIEEIKAAGMGGYFTEHDGGLFPADPMGVPWTASYIETTGDYIADIESDMAAEQRARATYEHLMDLTNDKDVLAPLSFLRQREIVHYQRFKELRNYYLNKKI